MNGCGLRSAIMNRDPHEDVFRPGFGVFDQDVEIAVIVEDAGIQQFKFRLVLAAPAIFLHQLRIGKFPLRIFVEHFQVRMRRRGVEVIIKFLHVLAVIAFAVRETKEPFLQNRIFAVPQRQRQTEALLLVADAGQTILAPAIGAAAGVVVRKVIPRRAAGAVILAHRAPLAFGKIRPPKMPGPRRREPPPDVLVPHSFMASHSQSAVKLVSRCCRLSRRNNL